jgi:DNA-binding transcriptional ArsR family regulator
VHLETPFVDGFQDFSPSRHRLKRIIGPADTATDVEGSRGYDRRVSERGEADLAAVGALLAEPARAKVLLALADGRSLAASVLAAEAGVAASTASHHLGRLADAGLISAETRGRHRYFSLAGPRVAELIEAVARVAPAQPVTSLRQGTRAHAVRYARSCYDHLAGRLGVALADALEERGTLVVAGGSGGWVVTGDGSTSLGGLGIEAHAGDVVPRCLDSTEQRSHVAGVLGRALLGRLVEVGWLTHDPRTRAMRVTDTGRLELPARLGVRLP